MLDANAMLPHQLLKFIEVNTPTPASYLLNFPNWNRTDDNTFKTSWKDSIIICTTPFYYTTNNFTNHSDIPAPLIFLMPTQPIFLMPTQ